MTFGYCTARCDVFIEHRNSDKADMWSVGEREVKEMLPPSG